MPRILQLIRSCGECPHFGYYSGGQSECKWVGQIVEDKTVVAPFCPLPHYPDQIIADLARTVKVERNAHQYVFPYMVIAHIARKFGTDMTQRGTHLKLHDGSTISIEFDHITAIELNGTEIHFMAGGKAYKVAPDITPPALYAAVEITGRSEPAWEKLELAH